jgi:serine/threonine protein kinase
MSYLHAKGIIHKDIKSGNIFLEGGKALVSDYGLFNITRLCYADQYAHHSTPLQSAHLRQLLCACCLVASDFAFSP